MITGEQVRAAVDAAIAIPSLAPRSSCEAVRDEILAEHCPGARPPDGHWLVCLLANSDRQLMSHGEVDIGYAGVVEARSQLTAVHELCRNRAALAKAGEVWFALELSTTTPTLRWPSGITPHFTIREDQER